jgi:hypothetical protein
MTSMLTFKVFVGSVEVMWRADAAATASADVALVESTADSTIASKIQAVVLIIADWSKELVDTSLAT